MKKRMCLVLALMVILSLASCSSSIHEMQYDMPEDGVWFCSELNVHLVFDMQYESVKNSYAVIDGTTITCYCSGEYNTPYIFLNCRHSAGGYKSGDTLYWWSVVEISDDIMILEDYYSGEQYSFHRVSTILD